MDQQYAPYQAEADALIKAKGYQESLDFQSLFFENDDHNELFWSARLHLPMTFCSLRSKRFLPAAGRRGGEIKSTWSGDHVRTLVINLFCLRRRRLGEHEYLVVKF